MMGLIAKKAKVYSTWPEAPKYIYPEQIGFYHIKTEDQYPKITLWRGKTPRFA